VGSINSLFSAFVAGRTRKPTRMLCHFDGAKLQLYSDMAIKSMSFLILISWVGGISLVILVLANHPFCVIFPDLHQTAHIVDQVGQRDIGQTMAKIGI
jgi:hypothetical protein